MSPPRETLYPLLPAYLRAADLAEGEPLRALLLLLDEERGRVEEDVLRLYESWFVETCPEWVVPYLADRVGLGDVRSNRFEAISLRPLVGNAVATRRRKGTPASLEQVARDASGWPAAVLEGWRRLGTTQHMRHPRLSQHRTPALRDLEAMDALGGAFDASTTTPDLRAEGRGGSLEGVEIFVWRLPAWPVEGQPACAATDAAEKGVCGWRFHPLGLDAPLFHGPSARPDVETRTRPEHVPAPLSRAALAAEIARVKAGLGSPWGILGEAPAFRVWVGGVEVGVEEMEVVDLSEWGGGSAGEVVAAEEESEEEDEETGSWPVVVGETSVDDDEDGFTEKRGDLHDGDPTINPAASELRDDGIDQDCDGRIDSDDASCVDGTDTDGDGLSDVGESDYKTNPNDPDTDDGGVRDGQEVVYDKTDPLTPDDDGKKNGSPVAEVSGPPRSPEFTSGLYIDPVLGRMVIPGSESAQVKVSYHYGFSAAMGGGTYDRGVGLSAGDVTIKVGVDLGDSLKGASRAGRPGQTVVVELPDNGVYALDSATVEVPAGVHLELRAAKRRRPVVALEGTLSFTLGRRARLTLDGLWADGAAITVTGPAEGDAELVVSHCTLNPVKRALLTVTSVDTVSLRSCVLGPVTVAPVLVTGRLGVRGCVLDAGSSEDLALSHAGTLRIEESTVLGRASAEALELASDSLFTGALAVARGQGGALRTTAVALDPDSKIPARFGLTEDTPRLVSTTWGHPGYARLHPLVSDAIRLGASDGGELGVFHALQQPQRERNLRAALREHLPLGLAARVHLIS